MNQLMRITFNPESDGRKTLHPWFTRYGWNHLQTPLIAPDLKLHHVEYMQ